MIEYTDLAERKIKQRQLKKKWIEITLQTPEYVHQSYSNRKIAYKKVNKLYLAVIFVKENRRIVIITAHWEKSFKPSKS